MHIYRDPHAIPEAAKGAVVALGNFDGVHLGHRAIMAECVRQARLLGVPAAVMTFEPHPREFFTGNREGLRIYNLRQKLSLIAQANIDIVYLLRFNTALAATGADAFVATLLHAQLHARHIVTGESFAFGKGRGGDSVFLAEKARILGMGYSAHPAVGDRDNNLVSSSAIRGLLAAGEIEKASGMLGAPYQLCGRIVHGDKRGHAIGFPTANIRLGGRFKPRFGVYAVRMNIDGKWLKGVANIGVKPTFGVSAPVVEVHCFDFSGNIYGKQATVELLHFLRDEKKFDGIDALKAQLSQDSLRARNLA